MNRDWIEVVIEKAIYKANPTFEWGDENREAIDKIVENLLPGIIDVIEQYILKKSKKILLQEKKKTKRFKASLDKRWGVQHLTCWSYILNLIENMLRLFHTHTEIKKLKI